MNAISEPSGDQTGSHASLGPMLRASEPSAFITHSPIPSSTNVPTENTIRRPSGDQAGANAPYLL